MFSIYIKALVEEKYSKEIMVILIDRIKLKTYQ
nr:MAG TPA: hypothetical protein [Caudoviricetes sp.]